MDEDVATPDREVDCWRGARKALSWSAARAHYRLDRYSIIGTINRKAVLYIQPRLYEDEVNYYSEEGTEYEGGRLPLSPFPKSGNLREYQLQGLQAKIFICDIRDQHMQSGRLHEPIHIADLVW